MDFFMSSSFYIFFICTFLNFHSRKAFLFYFFFCVQFKDDMVCILHMFFDGATHEIMLFFFMTDLWLKQQKATKISEMRTKEAEKTNIFRMDTRGHLCFALFPSLRGNPCSIRVSLSHSLSIGWISMGHAQMSRAVQGCQSIRLAEQHRLQSPRQLKCFFTA